MKSELAPPDLFVEPQTESFLHSLRSGDSEKLEDMEIGQARAAMKALLLAHQIPISANQVLQRQELIQGEEGRVSISIFQAAISNKSNNAVILFLHGGGWVLGDLECYKNMLLYLCQTTEVTIIGVEYRLAPECKFPSALRDCYAVLSWLKNHGSELVGDEGRIIVMGDSAGANLAAALCLYSRHVSGPEIFAQILLYPQLCLVADKRFDSREEFGNGEFFISKNSIDWAVEHYLNKCEEAFSPLASPFFAKDFSCFPTTLVLCAGLDPLRDEGKLFASKLKSSGVDTEYKCFDHTIHGFLSFAGTLDIGRRGLEHVVGWIKRHCY